jgi:FAD-dependent urate hydroxylase
MGVSLDIQKPQSVIPPTHYDVIVVGAGPYGLSAAAHLQGRGLKVAIFGKPLHLWRECMPQGMLLRSYWWATNISDPDKKYRLEQYFEAEGQQATDPFSREAFISYGLWFQKQAVPNVDETYVANIERKEQQFEVTLVDGRVLQSPTVVMVPGLAYYIYRPAEYNHMQSELVSHTADHNTFDHFAGKRVVVIGGGQSALETAALLHESGADTQLVSRSPLVWLEGNSMQNRTIIKSLKNPKAGIGPGWFNWVLEKFPYAFQRLPRDKKDELLRGRGRYGPAGAHWLKNRIIDKVKVHELRHVQKIKEVDNGAVLTLSNDETLHADHIILATGYRVDIKKLPMLSPSLVSELQTYQNAPILNPFLESSIPGLYFLGFSSVTSCGPLYRFVVGTDAAARRVTRAIVRQVAHK